MNKEEILNEIILSINTLLKEYRYAFSKEEFGQIKRIELTLKKEGIKNYQELVNLNMTLKPFFSRVWMQEITNFDDFTNGDNFKFVVTVPTKQSETYDKTKKEIISASLITSKHMGTFNRVNYALVCDINPENILAISSKDTHAITTKNNEYPDYFLSSITSSGSKVFHKTYVNAFKFPEQIEIDLVKENVKNNGDFILETYKNIYSDITLDAKKTTFKGVILFEPYTELDKSEADALAEKYSIPVKIIFKKDYYAKLSIHDAALDKHFYDLTDLETIIFILKHLDKVRDEYSNLIFENTFAVINIKDESTNLKMAINRELNLVSLYLPNDYRYITLDYSAGFDNLKFSVDNALVSEAEFKNILKFNKDNKVR